MSPHKALIKERILGRKKGNMTGKRTVRGQMKIKEERKNRMK